MKFPCFLREEGQFVLQGVTGKSGLIILLCTLFAPLGQAAAPTALPLGAFTGPTGAPTRVAVDSSGLVYTTDSAQGEVLVTDPFGRPQDVWSGFSRPLAIAISTSGKKYVSEEGTASVSVFDSRWKELYKLGNGNGEFLLPSHIALDPADENNIYVCDSKANTIKAYVNGRFSFAFGGSGTGDGQFDFPSGVHVSPQGEVFVVDQNNDRVQVFDRAGIFLRKFTLKTSGGMLSSGISGRAQGITGDAQGRLYICDAFQGQIKVFTQAGQFMTTLGNYGETTGKLRSPASLAIDSLGRLLVASVNNSRVELLGLDSFIQLSAVPARQIVAVGTEVTFGATLSGTGVYSYQWFFRGVPIVDNAHIRGALTPRLSIIEALPSDSGDYSLTVTGTDTTFYSPSAALTVINAPTLDIQPAIYRILNGSNVVLYANASGDNLSYQWQLNGMDITGATGSSLNIGQVEPKQSGHYSVKVSNALGSQTGEVATLNIVRAPKNSRIAGLAHRPNEGMHLSLDCEAGFSFALEGSDDLNNWAPLGIVVGDSAPVDYLDAEAVGLERRFYRVRWEE